MKNDYFKKVIITIRAKDLKIEDDFEISSDITVGELIDKFVVYRSGNNPTNLKKNYNILFNQKNKVLDKYATLAEAGVWDGSTLIFIPY